MKGATRGQEQIEGGFVPLSAAAGLTPRRGENAQRSFTDLSHLFSATLSHAQTLIQIWSIAPMFIDSLHFAANRFSPATGRGRAFRSANAVAVLV